MTNCLPIPRFAPATFQPTIFGAIAPHARFCHEVDDIPAHDFEPLALGVATKYKERRIYQAVTRGTVAQIPFVEGHPATREICSTPYADTPYARSRLRLLNQQTPLKWSMVGHGTAKASCGSLVRLSTCPSAHSVVVCRHHCWKFSCPECFYEAGMRRAAKLLDRKRALDQFREVDAGDAGGSDGRAWQHVVLSPPQELAQQLLGSLEGYKVLTRWALDMAKSLGISSGVMVLHPWRHPKENETAESIESGDIQGVHRWRLSPHFHVVGLSSLNLKSLSARNFARSGWFVKLVPRQEDMDDTAFFGTLEYIFSHAGVALPPGDNKKALSISHLFGDMTHNRLAVVHSSAVDDEIECPYPDCGQLLYRWPQIRSDNPELVPPDTRKVRTSWYARGDSRKNIRAMLRLRDDPSSLLDDLVSEGIAVRVVTSPAKPILIKTPPPTEPPPPSLGIGREPRARRFRARGPHGQRADPTGATVEHSPKNHSIR